MLPSSVFLPPLLARFQQKAEKWLQSGSILDCDFSGSTYQVLVADKKKEQFWVFIQMEEGNKIRDGFCTCEEAHDANGCIHLATAYLSLFQGSEVPLHGRFLRSIWNKLCRLYEERFDSELESFKRLGSGHFVLRSSIDKMLCLVKAKEEAAALHLEELLHKERQETEETSLKFSGLSSEELMQWRMGSPSPELRYELSYWSDLAKWFFKMQENGSPYSISFRYNPQGIPNWIQLDFDSIEAGFYLSEANLPCIIPSLAYVKSPLQIFSTEAQGIEKIHYDKKQVLLKITSTNRPNRAPAPLFPGISLQSWFFVPEQGFYPKEPLALLQNNELHGNEIEKAFNEHPDLMARFLESDPIRFDLLSLSYEIKFDPEWNLHLTAYLFHPGDLAQGDSRLFHSWAYLDHRGFFHIDHKLFDTVHTEIKKQKISEFVTAHRSWLNQQEGFATHMKSIEYQLSYTVGENERLTFARTLSGILEGVRMQDFGSWIYFEGYGFYAKTTSETPRSLKPGLSIPKEQIPIFIRMHREELQLVDKFFMEECPIVDAGLLVTLTKRTALTVTPRYQMVKKFENSAFSIFEEFFYIDGRGFYELPIHLRLPDLFRHPVEMEGEELDHFLTHEWPEISALAREIDPRLRPPSALNLKLETIQRVPEKGSGWYALSCHYQSEYGSVPLIHLKQAMEKKYRFIFSEAGLIDIRDKRFEWVYRLKDRWFHGENRFLITTLEAIRLNAFEPFLFHPIGSDEDIRNSNSLIKELTEMETPEEPVSTGLIGKLRPYQNLGLQWLWFLYRQQLSGLLCDEMGLGKTHQAMALLASIAHVQATQNSQPPLCFLIVCPTSVIYHWEEKLRYFLPNLSLCPFYGSKRSLEGFGEKYQILLTSYGILRNTTSQMMQLPFEVAIFDEVQVAKNQLSRVYHALRQIKARMRLGLTGTPIENHLRELKALFDIILPTYMPSEAEFRELFIKPIEKEQSIPHRELLNRLIKPFTLRRRKAEVLKELPEKTEEIAHCDLSQEQHGLYADVLLQRRQSLLEGLYNPESPIPYLHIFSLLSKLKQICNHPAVFLKDEAHYKNYSSGKWELFIELLNEAFESGQKVVIFSQFLGMLNIIEAHLAEQNIGFASIRGATQDRQKQLQRFHSDPDCLVFVGSLQAAGLGIDLTAASVVFHYDRWWNAARENQATDRVHRIGQKRGVQVFKLVTKGTFEEKIDLMITRKGKLMEDIVGSDEQNTLKVFSREELIELLEFKEWGEERHLFSDYNESL